ncbi:Os05g0573400 [Oryza sativa Japonica Group]|uniref:Os05g0573400 protein n=1 Tax=Oryza sativa subsp. japonica TaxID=39947 RepID=A0A0P0WRC6_ORYSJ|nr:hypothetical protein EE612_031260 [Oryza sativa]BAS95448.1 Os05g0573400 [Oryza sativa Japonica Group]
MLSLFFTYSATKFYYTNISWLICAINWIHCHTFNPLLYFIRNVCHTESLVRTQIETLYSNYLIDLSRGYIVVTSQLDVQKSLIISKVQLLPHHHRPKQTLHRARMETWFQHRC